MTSTVTVNYHELFPYTALLIEINTLFNGSSICQVTWFTPLVQVAVTFRNVLRDYMTQSVCAADDERFHSPGWNY